MRKIFLSIGFITIAILATTVLLNISQASEKSTPQADSMHQASHKRLQTKMVKPIRKLSLSDPENFQVLSSQTTIDIKSQIRKKDIMPQFHL